MFCSRASSEKETLPTPACRIPAFSTRYSTAPPLAALTAPATSGVTVPTLGFGIRLRGPRILPRRPTSGIMSGVAMQRSKSILPAWICSIRSSAPTISAPALRASSALASLANTAPRTVLQVPLGRVTTPRTIWSAWRGSTARLIASSMVSSNMAEARDFTILMASSSLYSFLRSMPSRAVVIFLPACAIQSALDLNAHGTGRAGDHRHSSVDIVGVEILHLLFGDITQLRDRNGASRFLARQLAARLQIDGLLDEVGDRRLLHLESEALVGIGGDHGRNGRTLFQ